MARITVFGAAGDLGRAIVREARINNNVCFEFDRKSIQEFLSASETKNKDFLESDIYIFATGKFTVKSLVEFDKNQIFEEINSNLILPIELTSKICKNIDPERAINFIFIGSTSSYAGFADTSVYCASKFGIRGFVESMNSEYANKKFKFTLVSMGTMESRMGEKLVNQKSSTFLKTSTVAKLILQAALQFDEAYVSELIIKRRRVEFK